MLRRSIYAANVAKIEAHNAETAAGLHSFTMGVNKFADMTAAEWKSGEFRSHSVLLLPCGIETESSRGHRRNSSAHATLALSTSAPALGLQCTPAATAPRRSAART